MNIRHYFSWKLLYSCYVALIKTQRRFNSRKEVKISYVRTSSPTRQVSLPFLVTDNTKYFEGRRMYFLKQRKLKTMQQCDATNNKHFIFFHMHKILEEDGNWGSVLCGNQEEKKSRSSSYYFIFRHFPNQKQHRSE